MWLVFIDLEKAFDTVDHVIVSKKLEYYGIQQCDLAWFSSYLSNRKQFSRVNGVNSSVEDIIVGVPQGSCLGPLLFITYINDLPQAVQNSAVSVYADDTSLCHQDREVTLLNEALNHDHKLVETWLLDNKLLLNVMKSYSMLIATTQKNIMLSDIKVTL